ncbi:MAG: hypothetical protein KZQ66_05230 [Candidatus Thiodiazotropha sp. (ex Lucinoma aequizonata)]|nr:hypothetical protein [Candidatus Thiodiazotropha sp. (ex Lucinoma aequizonata)]MCU7901469.1 hypothetical protein [Candidatus Thiodiazotropha sp. (ex Lucinoma aequizonata)]MCU7909582.1 hypothetical protein [Candidatus Thiodiazotropha sp. (ex Lucinoma aequizonata)]
MSEVHKVIFTGKLMPDANQERIIGLFSEKFKLGPEKAKKLIFSGKAATLKKDFDREKAEKYQQALEKRGLVIELDPKSPIKESVESEAINIPSGLALEPIDNADEDATEVLDSSLLPGNRCPKCGSSNMEMGICQDCGIVITKFLAVKVMDAELASQIEEVNHGSEDEGDPYTPPEAELVQPEEGEMEGPQSVPAGNGLAWIGRGWWHFKQAPLAWIVVMIVWIVLTLVVSMIPLLGFIAVTLLTPTLIAGLMVGCHEQDQGGDFSVSHLFACFANNAGQSVMVGLFYLLFMVLFFVGFGTLMFGSIGQLALQQADPEAMAMMLFSPSLVIGLIIASLLFIPIMMAYLFAPALVALEEMPAWEAIKLSFNACLKNILPFLLYSLVAMVLMIVGSIPFGLGLLIVSPILIGAIYSAYRDIFYA